MVIQDHSSGRKNILAGIFILMICMLVNCWHTHLWGPDEPREAEIAREISANNNWIVPYFNGIPFVEKPPLYYDVSALAYRIAPHPGTLRLHSALLGCLMLAALYLFAVKKCGHPVALCTCALCVSMPQFYRAAHWILLDIGVGTWVSAGLVCYGLWSLRKETKSDPVLAAFFFFFAALGMLTKGVITLVYLGMIILPHWLFFRRKKLPQIWTLLFFLIPVGLWIYLFYREGGVYFLHEHFINNIFGRLLHREFRLPGSPITISDVGHDSPLLFYFKRLPNMFGAAIVFLPFAVAWTWRTLHWKFFSWKLPVKIQWFWDLLTKPHGESVSKELLCYLMLWSFIPIFILSIPAIKEVTYLLPSYAGIALLLICYAADRLNWKKDDKYPWQKSFILPLLCFVFAVQLLSKISPILLITASVLIFLWMTWEVIRMFYLGKYKMILLPVLTSLIGGVMLGNTPELMEKSRLDRKCYCLFSEKVWQEVGRRQLYVKTTEESIRGALPFYGNRNILVLNSGKLFSDLLNGQTDHAILLYEREYYLRLKDPEFVEQTKKYRIIFPDFPKKADQFVLLVSRGPLN